jgi:hypothetical protein
MSRNLLIPLLALAMAAMAQPGDNSRWKGLEFLFGNWTAAGGGDPGTGIGRFTFQPDLNGQIVARRNLAETTGAGRHEDLLVIYRESEGVRKAIYFDSEGHVIRYRVSTPGEKRAVFDSEGEGPRYRLTYWTDGSVLKGKFEVGDRTYLEWHAEKEH